jgi:hypothetical protein
VVATIMSYFERLFLGDFSWLEVGSSYPLSKARSILYVQINPHLILPSPQIILLLLCLNSYIMKTILG